MKFDELELCEEVLTGLNAMNFVETTPIQEQAIPHILNQQDIIGCAQTGTGKTAAFLLPLINNLLTKERDSSRVNAIIMSPTRELAQQIDQQMEGFSYFVPVSSVAVYGGNDGGNWDIQRRGLQQGADVIIATPGRLISHLNLSAIDLSKVQYFILDEADRMLDMGFYDDIMTIVKKLPTNRQTIMFSATMPFKIRKLAKTILNNPIEVRIDVAKPPETIMQTAYICHDGQKLGIVRNLFENNTNNKAIIFSGAKIKVKELAKTLHGMGMKVGAMHSDLEQKERDQVMHEFKNNRIEILVATDIVSRGIDIDDITLVINYDVPYDVEDYVHRIGRTARAGDEGIAITLVAEDEQYRFKQIEDFLEKVIFKIPLPEALGESPEYNPTSSSKNKKRKGFKKGNKKSGKSKKSK